MMMGAIGRRSGRFSDGDRFKIFLESRWISLAASTLDSGCSNLSRGRVRSATVGKRGGFLPPFRSHHRRRRTTSRSLNYAHVEESFFRIYTSRSLVLGAESIAEEVVEAVGSMPRVSVSLADADEWATVGKRLAGDFGFPYLCGGRLATVGDFCDDGLSQFVGWATSNSGRRLKNGNPLDFPICSPSVLIGIQRQRLKMMSSSWTRRWR